MTVCEAPRSRIPVVWVVANIAISGWLAITDASFFSGFPTAGMVSGMENSRSSKDLPASPLCVSREGVVRKLSAMGILAG
jgi:hypothetical protein